ncbi:hypothetical protein TYRP_022052 [Tyrophagus putrescentiae]|nr:hypothetical protein TYRP_022052 [Tyrophagus putrescentiae]
MYRPLEQLYQRLRQSPHLGHLLWAAVLRLAPLNGALEATDKGSPTDAQQLRPNVVHHGEVLGEVVLKGSSRQQYSTAGRNLTQGPGQLPILPGNNAGKKRARKQENTSPRLPLSQHLSTAAAHLWLQSHFEEARRKGAISSGVPLFELLRPVLHYIVGNDDEDLLEVLCSGRTGEEGVEEGVHLEGLAEAHGVGEDAATAYFFLLFFTLIFLLLQIFKKRAHHRVVHELNALELVGFQQFGEGRIEEHQRRFCGRVPVEDAPHQGLVLLLVFEGFLEGRLLGFDSLQALVLRADCLYVYAGFTSSFTSGCTSTITSGSSSSSSSLVTTSSVITSWLLLLAEAVKITMLLSAEDSSSFIEVEAMSMVDTDVGFCCCNFIAINSSLIFFSSSFSSSSSSSSSEEKELQERGEKACRVKEEHLVHFGPRHWIIWVKGTSGGVLVDQTKIYFFTPCSASISFTFSSASVLSVSASGTAFTRRPYQASSFGVAATISNSNFRKRA